MSDSRVYPESSYSFQQSGAGTITRIRLENFMCHSSLQIELGEYLNFITGQNGSTVSPYSLFFFLIVYRLGFFSRFSKKFVLVNGKHEISFYLLSLQVVKVLYWLLYVLHLDAERKELKGLLLWRILSKLVAGLKCLVELADGYLLRKMF